MCYTNIILYKGNNYITSNNVYIDEGTNRIEDNTAIYKCTKC